MRGRKFQFQSTSAAALRPFRHIHEPFDRFQQSRAECLCHTQRQSNRPRQPNRTDRLLRERWLDRNCAFGCRHCLVERYISFSRHFFRDSTILRRLEQPELDIAWGERECHRKYRNAAQRSNQQSCSFGECNREPAVGSFNRSHRSAELPKSNELVTTLRLLVLIAARIGATKHSKLCSNGKRHLWRLPFGGVHFQAGATNDEGFLLQALVCGGCHYVRREPVPWRSHTGADGVAAVAGSRSSAERQSDHALWQRASYGTACERPWTAAGPAASNQDASLAAAEHRTGIGAATVDGSAIGSRFVEVSCMVDSAGIWPAVWPGGFRCAGRERLADVTGIHGTEGQQWENANRI